MLKNNNLKPNDTKQQPFKHPIHEAVFARLIKEINQEKSLGPGLNYTKVFTELVPNSEKDLSKIPAVKII